MNRLDKSRLKVNTEVKPPLRISIVIGYEHAAARLPLLKKCLSSLNDVDEVCIVETGPRKFLNSRNLLPSIPKTAELKYLKVYTATPYNRAWTFNVGVKHLASKEVIVTADADLVFPPDFCTIVRDAISTHDCVGVAWKKIIYLNARDTEVTLELPSYEVLCLHPLRTATPSKGGAAGGAFFCTARAYFAFYGMDERFYGRTSEDNAHWAKLEAFGYVINSLPVTLYHLYHPVNTFTAPNRNEVFQMLNWSVDRWCEEINLNWGSLDGFHTRGL